MNRLHSVRLGALLCFGLIASIPAHASGPVDTVDWATANTPAAGGVGTLAGGTVSVSYTTFLYVSGGISSGESVNGIGWDTSLATSTAVGTGVTNDSAVALATPGLGSQTQTFNFSSPVIDPILYICHIDSSQSVTLPGSFAILDSHNAQLSGSTINFAGATGSGNDGFAAQLSGTFSTFSFSTSESGVSPDIFGFSVGGDVLESATPEPGALALLATGGLTGGIFLKRRRKR